jgi:hypothetical protein
VANTGACNYATFNSVIINVSTTGISTLNTMNELTLFPNPNNGDFIIKGAVGFKGQVAVEIKNILGQTVYQNMLLSEHGKINSRIILNEALPCGLYSISLRSESSVKVVKFIKQ